MTDELKYPDPPITSAAFVLRPWSAEDAEDVAAAYADPIIQRFISGMPHPYTLDHARTFIATAEANRLDGRSVPMAISEPSTGRAIGSITLHANEPAHWYIGYWMAPDWRNRGITSAAVKAFSRWAFSAYPSLVRLSLYTVPDNRASQRVAEGAGFIKEGVLRQWDFSGDTPADVVMYSLLRQDL